MACKRCKGSCKCSAPTINVKNYRVLDYNSNEFTITQEMLDKLLKLDPNLETLIIQENEPDNKAVTWGKVGTLDTEDPSTPEVISSMLATIQELTERVVDVEYRFNTTLDSGDFSNNVENIEFGGIKPIEPGDDEDATFNPDWEPDGNELDVEGEIPNIHSQGKNVRAIQIKGGLAKDFKADALLDRELGYVKDRRLLYIGVGGGAAHLINVGGTPGGNEGGPAGSTEYIDLKPSDTSETVYRIRVSEGGELYVYDALVDTAENQAIVNDGGQELKGLYISMFYAGGEDQEETIENLCSHNFIELHNYRNTPINLKGCSIQFSRGGSTWNALPLKGIIPASGSFLIRGSRCAPKGINTTMMEIDTYDMDWPEMRLPITGTKVYLTVGTAPCDIPNPYASRGTAGSFRTGYIDLVGLAGHLSTNNIDGFETATANILKRGRVIYRKYFSDYNQRPANTMFGDTNSNKNDFLYAEIDKTFNVKNWEAYKPGTSKDGPKSLYFDKNTWDRNKPNMVSNSFGRGANTTRTFNWISVGYYDEHLQYRVKGTTNWTTVESIKDPSSLYKRRVVKGFDGIWFTVHKQIISGLTSGTYEYRCGRLNTDYWSEIFEFKMVTAGPNTKFGFVVTADQQSWNWAEYQPWKIAADHIHKWENGQDPNVATTGGGNIAFHVNVGDMTENGIRPHEWLYYYEAGKALCPNYSQINVVGNNDLCPNPGELVGKVNPESFDWFYTYEHDPNNIPMFLGDTMKSVYSFDYGPVHFVCLNTNNYIEEQKAWFRKDMREVHSRTTKPRWIIVLMHDACFNIVTDSTPKRDSPMNQGEVTPETNRYSWSRLMEEWGVHLVLSGHKHTYSRSKPLLERVSADGVVAPLQPIAQTLGTPGTGEVQVSEISGVVYIKTQATGSKLDSNKDVPAQSIYWNAKHFPGTSGTSSVAQKYPTYLKIDVTPTEIKHKAYQILNIMPTSSYSYDPYSPITLAKERVEIDSSTITTRWKNIII